MKLILIVAGVMLVLGSVVALIWWRLADAMFPGASAKTGQHIGLRREERGRPVSGQVIAGFDEDAPKPGA